MFDIIGEIVAWFFAILLFIPIAFSEVTGVSTKTIYGAGIIGSYVKDYVNKKSNKKTNKSMFYEDA